MASVRLLQPDRGHPDMLSVSPHFQSGSLMALSPSLSLGPWATLRLLELCQPEAHANLLLDPSPRAVWRPAPLNLAEERGPTVDHNRTETRQCGHAQPPACSEWRRARAGSSAAHEINRPLPWTSRLSPFESDRCLCARAHCEERSYQPIPRGHKVEFPSTIRSLCAVSNRVSS